MKKRITNAFTVDVEEYFHASALSDVVARSDWDDLPSSVERCTDRILALLDQTDQQGTFFVLGWIAERFPELVRRIVQGGHEIACHGYSHQLVYRQSENEFRQETQRAKSVLEDLSGQPVTGYRAATFSFSKETPWAYDVLGELGFLYDSSVFPITHDRYGDPMAPRFPYTVQGRNEGARELVEFPMTTWSVAGLRVPVSGGGYFRLLPEWLISKGLESVNRRDGKPFIFYIHPWELDADQPRFDVSRSTKFRHYTNLAQCEDRLSRLLEKFRFSTCTKVLTNSGLSPDAAMRSFAGQAATG